MGVIFEGHLAWCYLVVYTHSNSQRNEHNNIAHVIAREFPLFYTANEQWVDSSLQPGLQNTIGLWVNCFGRLSVTRKTIFIS